MKMAIIGIGRWGRNLLREFSDLNQDIVCVHTGSEENKKWVEENFPNVSCIENIEKICQDPSIDRVVIATPISTHDHLVETMLSAGKHIFVEKPLSDSMKNSARSKLTKLSSEKNKVLFVGYIFIYHDIFEQILKITQHGRKVNKIVMNWNKWGSFKEDIYWNLLSHEIAISVAILGEPQDVMVHKKKSRVSDVDLLNVELIYANYKTVLIEIDRVSKTSSKSVQLILSDNSILSWEDNSLYRQENKDAYKKQMFTSKIEPLRNECSAFLSAIESGKQPIADGVFATKVEQIITQIKYKSNI